jgi:hypothetical protein
LQHVYTTGDVIINVPTDKAVAVSLGIGCPCFRAELMLASGAAVSPGYSAGDPPFHATFEELQINLDVTHFLALVDLLALAQGQRPLSSTDTALTLVEDLRFFLAATLR